MTMEWEMHNLEGERVGSILLPDVIFGLEPRLDLLHRCVRWQLARARQGTHAVKNRADVNYSTKKIFRQKGTGRARHGSVRANLFRGGGRSFGPVVRSHAHDLPKKVRALALRHALSHKVKESSLVVLDTLACKEAKTKSVRVFLKNLNVNAALFVDGSQVDRNFSLASRNIPLIDVLPVQGINVYDIVRRNLLVLTREALQALEARFK